MHVTYKPDDNPGDAQTWEFDPKRLRMSQQQRIEDAYGEPWDVYYANLMRGEARARRVLLWYLQSTDHAGLKLRDMPDLMQSEVQVEMTSAELLDMYDQSKAAVPPGQEAMFERVFAKQLAEAREREGLPPEPGVIDGELVPAGKAERRPSRNSSKDPAEPTG